jgi:hypothetical protein
MLSNPVRHLPRSVSGGDRAVLIGLAALAALVAGVWLTGELAALLASGTTVAVGPSDLARVLTHLPDHLADPARAWPPAARRELPGPAAFYAAAVIVTASVVAAGVAAVLLWRWAAFGGHEHRGSRWAHAGDLRRLKVRRPTPGRLTLGRVGRSLVATEKRHSAIVIAPTNDHRARRPRHPGMGRPRARRQHQDRPRAQHAPGPQQDRRDQGL